MNHKDFAKRMSEYTLLYVEDDDNVRNYICEFLNRYFKEVYACDCAEIGLELYNKHKPDIMLLDINLPGINGISFATHIRKYDKKSRIVILTAYTDRKFVLKAIELELTRYLVKPVTNEDLFLVFEKCVDEIDANNIINLGNGNIYSKRLVSIISNSKKIPLRKKEALILEYFIEHEGEVVRYDVLESGIFYDEVMSLDAIRSQIKNIRKKIGNDCLENITGVGYIFKSSL